MPGVKRALTAEQRTALQAVRDHASKPYLRERAAAVLKIAEGQSLAGVAREGLLRRWDRHALASWWRRFQADGVAGLHIRPGRGRKSAFSPSGQDGRRR